MPTSTFFFCEQLSKQHKKENTGKFYSRNVIPELLVNISGGQI